MKPSLEEIKRIGEALMQSLDGEWTDREFILYRTVSDTLKKYENTAKNYAINRRDRENILLNIRDRHWFQKSGHKSHINNFIESMSIKKLLQHPLEIYLIFKHPTSGARVELHATEASAYLKCGEQVDYLFTKETGIEGVPQNTIFGPKAFLPMDVIHIMFEILHYYDESQKIIDAAMSPKNSVTIRLLSEGWGKG